MQDGRTPASVRRELNEKFDALSIFKRDRAAALYHFCIALELLPVPLSVDSDLALAQGRHATEATTRAIPAIFRLCPAGTSTPVFNGATLAEAAELIDFASRVDQIMYCYELADRGQFDVRYDPLSQKTRFTYTSADESAADTLLRTHERDSKVVEANATDQALAAEIIRQASADLTKSILFVSPDAISYTWDSGLLSRTRQLAAVATKAMRWEFPENLGIGNLNFGDIRGFWGALNAITTMHGGAHLIAAQGQPARVPRESVLLLKSRKDWGELVAEVGGISPSAATELLWWFTFDPKVAGVTAAIQPFFEITPGQLALPGSLVATYGVERNLQKILNRHPSLRPFANQVKSAKELIALGHLQTLFPGREYAVKATIIIKDLTDADLVICERGTGFVLVVQHKWLIAPETINESSANDDELRNGALQAIEARDAFRKNHALLRRALDLPDSHAIAQLEAAVVCRGAEPTAFLGQLPTPVVLETAFEELWKAASGSLEKLWRMLTSRPDHAEAASRYDDTYASITVAGLHFSIPAFSISVKL